MNIRKIAGGVLRGILVTVKDIVVGVLVAFVVLSYAAKPIFKGLAALFAVE